MSAATCPICEGIRGCMECIDGTVESYYMLQLIGLEAVENPRLVSIVEQMDEIPEDSPQRALLISWLARRALQVMRVA
jgi:hypothetical protein